MTMNIENDEDKELLLDTPLEEAGEEPQVEAAEDEGDEISLDIEGEDGGDETDLVKRLRLEIRERDRRLADRDKAQAARAIDPGPKPTLEGCDWDEEKFETALTTWHDTKRKAESAQTEHQQQAQQQAQEFARIQARHQQRAEALRIPDFAKHEKALIDVLGPELAGAALVMANDSAKLVAAVGSKPALLEKLDAEPNGLRKLAMLKDWEHKIVVKKKAPTPDAATITRSTTSVAPAGEDKQAAKLLKKAQETGKMDEYRAYMKSKRAA